MRQTIDRIAYLSHSLLSSRTSDFLESKLTLQRSISPQYFFDTRCYHTHSALFILGQIHERKASFTKDLNYFKGSAVHFYRCRRLTDAGCKSEDSVLGLFLEKFKRIEEIFHSGDRGVIV
ncbi:hypothetical protein FRB94_004334 [Tulasnella sp. JGI-2019a]|nr:hypothetical protein FRB94_004334 [Tulasnella sp. JGI-2019a]KAG9039284.1 hypothetical protein FRB95_011869 [Tulasnella sp. JGI-2019a]